MQEPSPWDQQQTAPPVVEESKDPSKLPMFCMVIAIIDLSMGGLTLMGVPMALLGSAVLPDGSPLEKFMVPTVLVGLMIGGAAIAADIAMLRKKPIAVMLSYLNIAAMAIGIVFVWVQLPATIETQKMQLASQPNAPAMPPGMESMMTAGAVGGAAMATLVRLSLIVVVLIAVKKFKAWQTTQA